VLVVGSPHRSMYLINGIESSVFVRSTGEEMHSSPRWNVQLPLTIVSNAGRTKASLLLVSCVGQPSWYDGAVVLGVNASGFKQSPERSHAVQEESTIDNEQQWYRQMDPVVHGLTLDW
jgi:hypothetical protein